MTKKGILVVALLLICSATAWAQNDELHGTVDVTYLSRYIWRGFDMYPDNDSAIQPSVDLDLFGTGFGMNVMYSQPGQGKHEDDRWMPITLYYTNKIWKAETCEVAYKVGWTYYNWSDNADQVKDLQEVFASFSMPNAFCNGVVPSYTIVALWPSHSGSAARAIGSGWLHVLGLSYDMPIGCIWPEMGDQKLHLSAQTVYNDGVGKLPASTGVVSEHDWSHAVFGVSTDFPLSCDLTFTPGVYYQSSWEDTVNSSDEYWTRLSLSYKF